MVNQMVDRTFKRETSFFDAGCVAHVSTADPICERLSGLAGEAAQAAGANVHRPKKDKDLTYVAMEGPQFSTKSESRIYRQLGCDVIGMTNMPEAKLAREAELPYATMAMVTDYDCWHEGHGSVDVASVIAVLQKNSVTAQQAVLNLIQTLSATPRTVSPQGIETNLDVAVITGPDARDPKRMSMLDAVAGRYLNQS